MPTYHIKDSGPGAKEGRNAPLDTKSYEGNLENNKALNRVVEGKRSRQWTGGDQDNTPGQVAKNNVDAIVPMTATEAGPKGLDSMGGSEFRGRDNHKMGDY